MRRCLLPSPLTRDEIALSPDAQRYLCQVLRLNEADRFIGFDGLGSERIFVLSEQAGAWFAQGEGSCYQGQQGAPVGLIFALPKGDKLDQVARQTTELGLSSLYLWTADRSIGVWKADKVKQKLARVERVISEAARQSGRADTLQVFPPQKLIQLIDEHRSVPLKLYFDPEASLGWPEYESSLASHTHTQTDSPGSIQKADINSLTCLILIGPEGGLSPQEIDQLKEAGWTGVKLKSPILRTENAAVVATAIALDRLGFLA